MRPAGTPLGQEDERVTRARFRTARDAGHTRDCAFVFARRYLTLTTLNRMLTLQCCCGNSRADLARLLALVDAA